MKNGSKIESQQDIQVNASDIYQTEDDDDFLYHDFKSEVNNVDLLKHDWKNTIQRPLDFNYSFVESVSTPKKIKGHPSKVTRDGFGIIEKVVSKLDHEKMINSNKNEELFGSAKRAYEKKEIAKLYTFKAPRTAPISFRKPNMQRQSKTSQGARGSYHSPRNVDRSKRTIHNIDAGILKIMAEHRRFIEQSKEHAKRKLKHPPKKRKKQINPFEMLPTHFNIEDQELTIHENQATMDTSFSMEQAPIFGKRLQKPKLNVPIPHTDLPSPGSSLHSESNQTVRFAQPSQSSNIERGLTPQHQSPDEFVERVVPQMELDTSPRNDDQHEVMPPIFRSTPKTPTTKDDPFNVLSPFTPLGEPDGNVFKPQSRRFSEEISVRDVIEKKNQEIKRKITPVGDLILKLDRPLHPPKRKAKPKLSKSRLQTLSKPKSLKKTIYTPPPKPEKKQSNFIHRLYRPQTRMGLSINKQMVKQQEHNRKAKKKANDYTKTMFHSRKSDIEDVVTPPARHLPIMTTPIESRSSSRFSRTRKRKKKKKNFRDAVSKFIKGNHNSFSLDAPSWEFYRTLDEPTKRHKSIYRVDHGGVVLYKYSEPGLRPGEEEEQEIL